MNQRMSKPASVSSLEVVSSPRLKTTPPSTIIDQIVEPGWHVCFWYKTSSVHAHNPSDFRAALQKALEESKARFEKAPSKYIASLIGKVDANGAVEALSGEVVRAFVQEMRAIGFVWFYDNDRWFSVKSYKETT